MVKARSRSIFLMPLPTLGFPTSKFAEKPSFFLGFVSFISNIHHSHRRRGLPFRCGLNPRAYRSDAQIHLLTPRKNIEAQPVAVDECFFGDYLMGYTMLYGIVYKNEDIWYMG